MRWVLIASFAGGFVLAMMLFNFNHMMTWTEGYSLGLSTCAKEKTK